MPALLAEQKMSPGEIAGVVIIAIIFSVIAIYLCGCGGPPLKPTEVSMAERRERKARMAARFKERRERRDEYNAPILPTSNLDPSEAPRTNRIVMFALANNDPTSQLAQTQGISTIITTTNTNSTGATTTTELKPPQLVPPPPARIRSPSPIMNPSTPPGIDAPISQPIAISLRSSLCDSNSNSNSTSTLGDLEITKDPEKVVTFLGLGDEGKTEAEAGKKRGTGVEVDVSPEADADGYEEGKEDAKVDVSNSNQSNVVAAANIASTTTTVIATTTTATGSPTAVTTSIIIHQGHDDDDDDDEAIKCDGATDNDGVGRAQSTRRVSSVYVDAERIKSNS